MLSLLTLCSLAFAQTAPAAADAPPAPVPVHAWTTTTYQRPIANAQVLMGRNGDPFVQIRSGGELGARHVHRPSPGAQPNVVATTRINAAILYGLPYQSMGVDAAIGAFVGPRLGKAVTLQHGPDVSFDFYGTSASPDYFLPPGAIVELRNAIEWQPIEQLGFVAEADPGWALTVNRQPVERYLGLFDEVKLLAAASLKVGPSTFVVGYQVVYDTWGPRPGLILSLR